jgi:hypothetical protein
MPEGSCDAQEDPGKWLWSLSIGDFGHDFAADPRASAVLWVFAAENMSVYLLRKNYDF